MTRRRLPDPGGAVGVPGTFPAVDLHVGDQALVRVRFAPRPAVAGGHPRGPAVGELGPEHGLHVGRRLGHDHLEILVPFPRLGQGVAVPLRVLATETEQPPDPQVVGDTAAAPPLTFERDVVVAHVQPLGVSLDGGQGAHLTGLDHLMFVEEEDRHPGGVDQVLDLRVVTALLPAETVEGLQPGAMSLVGDQDLGLVGARLREVVEVPEEVPQLFVAARDEAAHRLGEGPGPGGVPRLALVLGHVAQELHGHRGLAAAGTAGDGHDAFGVRGEGALDRVANDVERRLLLVEEDEGVPALEHLRGFLEQRLIRLDPSVEQSLRRLPSFAVTEAAAEVVDERAALRLRVKPHVLVQGQLEQVAHAVPGRVVQVDDAFHGLRIPVQRAAVLHEPAAVAGHLDDGMGVVLVPAARHDHQLLVLLVQLGLAPLLELDDHEQILARAPIGAGEHGVRRTAPVVGHRIFEHHLDPAEPGVAQVPDQRGHAVGPRPQLALGRRSPRLTLRRLGERGGERLLHLRGGRRQRGEELVHRPHVGGCGWLGHAIPPRHE